MSWEWSKSERGGRARLDYTQNASIKTLVAPYAVRPRPGAPVSAPIRWEELDDPDLRPDRWTIRTHARNAWPGSGTCGPASRPIARRCRRSDGTSDTVARHRIRSSRRADGCTVRPMARGRGRRHDAGVDPIVTGHGIDVSPGVVIPIVIVAIVVGVLGVTFRTALLAGIDELADLWREYAPVAARKVLRRRPGMPDTPWFCDRCHSRNGTPVTLCYSCGARREEAEADVPDCGGTRGLLRRTERPNAPARVAVRGNP